MPITNNGYEAETQSQAESRIKILLQKNMGEDVVLNVNGSPMTSIFQAEVQESLYADEMLGEAYQQTQLSTATGTNLDNIANISGISRTQDTYATVEVTFTGKIGTVIPSSFLVSTSSNVIFKTLASGTITSTGGVSIECQCITTGESGNVKAQSITVIVSSLEGLESVNNSSPATGGGEQETDDALRTRIKTNANANIGTGALLVNQLLSISGVSSVNYKENNSYSEADGIPPLCVYFVIDGGTNTDIGNVFYNYSAIPFYTFGDQTVSVKNSFGRTIEYHFDRPSVINLTVRILYTLKNEKSTLTSAFQSEMETQIKSYVNGLGNNITLSGSQILAGISESFITNNQSEFSLISKIEIQLKRTSESNFVDSLSFAFKEHGSVTEFVYE